MKINKILLLTSFVILSAGVLAACDNNLNTGSSSSDQTKQSSSQETNQSLASSSSSSEDSAPTSDLTQRSVYDYLLNAGYTGVGTLPKNYDGLSNAVQSQSANYVLIGQVEDVSAFLSAHAIFNASGRSVQQGQWVFVKNMKVGTLKSLDDLKNIQ